MHNGPSLNTGYTTDGTHWDKWLQKWFAPLLIAGILTNLTGLLVTILEPDGALYATIAKTMVLSGDYINLAVEGKDWLDKPHFPFWITALSYKLFGINTVAYKLPAILFWAMGGLYTYFFARALYSKNIALLSVLIYLTAAHLVISNNDVRAEPYLTGLVIGSVYHFFRAEKAGFHLVMGSLLAACAVMTKGPFVLLVIGAGFITDWLLKKQWKQFLHYRWWLAVFLTGLLILPELYSLYLQFDRHPEKLVFGRTGVSGIRFFFWDSQFGRFLNTGPIKGKGDLSFYVHTLLWAFLPWSLLLFAAVFYKTRAIFLRKTTVQENITIGVSLVTFVLFSLSRFQLPHYMNIVFPFFSIITAQYIYGLHRTKTIRAWTMIQNGIFILLTIALPALIIYYKLSNAYLIITVLLIAFAGVWYAFRNNGTAGMAGRSFMLAVVLFCFLNVIFYPALLHYQSGSRAAAFINKHKKGMQVATYQEDSYSFAFYIDQPLQYHRLPETLKTAAAKQHLLVFTREEYLDSLRISGLSVRPLQVFPHFHISQLTGRFLNAKTRHLATRNMAVAEISAAN